MPQCVKPQKIELLEVKDYWHKISVGGKAYTVGVKTSLPVGKHEFTYEVKNFQSGETIFQEIELQYDFDVQTGVQV